MFNIGFWNINRRAKKKHIKSSVYDISSLLVDFIRESELDILCLAEVDSDTIESTLSKINRLSTSGEDFSLISNEESQLYIITRLDQDVFSDYSNTYKSKRWSAQHIRISHHLDFNLVMVHFPSKLYWSNESQAMECVNLIQDIRTVEDKSECKRTIVIGDFNMDPFETGMVSANGLHALSDLSILNKGQTGRTVNQVFYPFFYNPMWNHFGDHQPPTGTYYHDQSTHISHRWHLFDQVLVRPALHKNLRIDSTEIVTKIDSTSLITEHGIPDKKNLAIDHLPIILELYI